MSRAANCYDNAFMESCFGTIKTELEMTEYEHSRQARSDIRRVDAVQRLRERPRESLELGGVVLHQVALLEDGEPAARGPGARARMGA